MNLLKNAFKYGLVGRNYYYHDYKTISSMYSILKKTDLFDIKTVLEDTKPSGEIILPRITALTCFIDSDVPFRHLFRREIKSVQQFLLFVKVMHFLKLDYTKPVKNAIREWIYKYLDEDMALEYPVEFRYILGSIRFPKALPRITVITNFLKHSNRNLPKLKALDALKKDFLNAQYEPEKHICIIHSHRIGVKDVSKFLYEFSEEEKTEIVLECLIHSKIKDLRVLKDIFIGPLPQKVLDEIITVFNHENYFDKLLISDIVSFPPIQTNLKKTKAPCKVFVDTSYSMTPHMGEIIPVVDYLKKVLPIEVYSVSDEIKPFTSDIDTESVSTDINKILSYINIGDMAVLITDGHHNFFDTIKKFRRNYPQTELLIWYVGSRKDIPSKFRNIYHLYGNGKNIATFLENYLADTTQEIT